MTALDALTPNLIEQNAESDPDNPPLTNAELKRMQTARAVRAVRASRGMTQAAFAETYGIAVTRLRDWEQGRHVPDSMALAYLATIAHEPEAVARAFEKARAA
ncbi:helix-turn-helix domain-containing protein [Lichenifustis flavocetrariae]|uniref:Helix-turn-helix domain-containing protein n=1 Tax=Lichenifustis flavocetrariae TaxID=2949735 RepID=A0AA42CJ06_9HYPH|nr:helix-turn-helix domain-containing protein [Lichenifustis flavocetrariae]MCW6508929.1 helix-turn-helix domain-containing protein [Lichenifustis flavocetrariae]